MTGYAGINFIQKLTKTQRCSKCHFGLKEPSKNRLTGELRCSSCVEDGKDYVFDAAKNEEMLNLEVSCSKNAELKESLKHMENHIGDCIHCRVQQKSVIEMRQLMENYPFLRDIPLQIIKTNTIELTRIVSTLGHMRNCIIEAETLDDLLTYIIEELVACDEILRLYRLIDLFDSRGIISPVGEDFIEAKNCIENAEFERYESPKEPFKSDCRYFNSQYGDDM